MVRPIIFFIFVFILLGIIRLNSKEGFSNFLGNIWTTKNNGTPSNCNSRAVQPTELGVGSIEASPPPASDLPTAPSGFQSKDTPKPYRNPTDEPAKYIRILAVKEDLQAFFGFQAQSLDGHTDSSTQIPLTRARADLSELINVQSVMERNPGLPSRINNKQLDDISSNLAYLRDILNDLKVDKIVEGFASKKGKKSNKRATLKELQEFQIKLVVELQRLQASGTTDRITQGRVNTLNTIKNEIDDVISKIDKGLYTPNQIPIFKSDINKSLPILGNKNKPLPQIVKNLSLPPAIASLFPGGLSPRDNEQAAQINNIAKRYMKNIFEDTSWDLNLKVKYKSPKSKSPKRSRNNIVSGIPGVKRSVTPTVPGTRSKKSKHGSRSMYSYKTDSGTTPGLPGVSDRTFPDTVAGHLDWKKRSKQIINQITKRGLNAKQFGAMPSSSMVSKDFSWRGYTRMLCSRLNATTDPGLSVTVGCPPENWPGWRQ